MKGILLLKEVVTYYRFPVSHKQKKPGVKRIQATFLDVKLFPVYLSWSFSNAMAHTFNCIANISLSPITQYATRFYKPFS